MKYGSEPGVDYFPLSVVFHLIKRQGKREGGGWEGRPGLLIMQGG